MFLKELGSCIFKMIGKGIKRGGGVGIRLFLKAKFAGDSFISKVKNTKAQASAPPVFP